MAAYGILCTEFYDLDKSAAPAEALDFYVQRARKADGRILEPMCGSGRFLLPMSLSGLAVDGVDSSPAMLEACRSRSRELPAKPSLFLQDLALLELPRKYRMAFIPSGSIGLITEEEELLAALSRICAHLESNGSLLLEIVTSHSGSQSPTELEPRVVLCADGSSIIYRCIASRSTRPNTICYSGTYTRHNRTQVVETEAEELLLRWHDPQELCRMLHDCGFKATTVSGAAELPFLSESGCTLVEAVR